MNSRIIWIDHLRGFCMLLILWFHTEMYYAGSDITPYDAYVANALTAFFFLSGYLFAVSPFRLRHKLHSIFRGIVVPYFFFTLLLAIPKAIVNDVALTEVVQRILLGNGSWFVTALITSEVIFACAVYINRKYLLHSLPIASIVAAYLLTGTTISEHYNYWNFHNALVALPFLYLGYQYHLYENSFHSLKKRLTQIGR